jgi:regulator of replication initiation timing
MLFAYKYKQEVKNLMKRAIFITIILGLIIGCSGKKRSNAQVNPSMQPNSRTNLQLEQLKQDGLIKDKQIDVAYNTWKAQEDNKTKEYITMYGKDGFVQTIASPENVKTAGELIGSLKKEKPEEKEAAEALGTSGKLSVDVLKLGDTVTELTTQIEGLKQCNTALTQQNEKLNTGYAKLEQKLKSQENFDSAWGKHTDSYTELLINPSLKKYFIENGIIPETKIWYKNGNNEHIIVFNASKDIKKNDSGYEEKKLSDLEGTINFSKLTLKDNEATQK